MRNSLLVFAVALLGSLGTAEAKSHKSTPSPAPAASPAPENPDLSRTPLEVPQKVYEWFDGTVGNILEGKIDLTEPGAKEKAPTAVPKQK